MIKKEKCKELTKKFTQYYPGGHSNLRITPIEATQYRVFVDHAKGSHVWDIDGNEYTEFAGALGPTILGYCDDEYVASLCENIKRMPTVAGSGVLYSPDDVAIVEKLSQYIPCAEQFKFASTGSEAVQVAFRIARAYTGKLKVVRFVEHYHGWLDNVLGGLIRPGKNGEYELYDDPVNDDHYSQGTSPYARNEIIVIPWNDFDALRTVFEKHHDEIAIIHFEAMVNNCFGMFPKPGFLELIRELCDKYNVVMSMDEVITGIRLGLGGAQKFFGITPDICTMGKAVSAGMPVSLVAGKKKIMDYCFSTRRVLAPGTFNGWNLGMHAILTTLEIIEKDNGARFKKMLEVQEVLVDGIMKLSEKYNIDVRITEAPGVFNTMFGIKGGRTPVYTLDELKDLDMEFMNKLRLVMQEEGIITIPGIRWYMCLAHTKTDAEFALEKMDLVLKQLLGR